MVFLFAQIISGMSAIGTKRTSLFAPHMFAFGGKADMPFCICKCPLMTQSGHRPFLSTRKGCYDPLSEPRGRQ
jgi:hypothetical protein